MIPMQKSRFTRALILFVCGIGIGFTLRTIVHKSTRVDGAIADSSSENKTQGSDALPKEKSEFSAANMEEQFAAALKHRDEEEQKQASRAIFAGLGLDELTPLAARVEQFATEFAEKDSGIGGWILCNEFYRRWGELAPAEALKYLDDHPSNWGGPAASVWTSWARTNPDGAVAAYDPKLESEYSQELKEAILDGLCSVDPARALRFADAHEMGSDYDFIPGNHDELYARYSACSDLLEYVPVERPHDTFGRALYSWMHLDPEGAFEAMLALNYRSLQQASLNALFSYWLMYDPDAALRSLKKITDRGLRESTTHRAMQAYLLHHPRKALAKILELPKYVSYRHRDNPSAEIDPFAEVDFSNKSEVIEMDEEDDARSIPWRYCDTTTSRTYGRMDLISEAAASLGITEGKAAWDTAAAIDDENKRAAALGGALAGWLIFDVEEAVGFTSAGITNQSFEDLGGSDFPRYAARLVSKKLAQHDFKKAIAWVDSLPAGPLREAGIDTAAKTRLDVAWHSAGEEASPEGWVDPKVHQKVQKREYAPVMDWLASLPPSTGRDHATSWLVFQLSGLDDPSDALRSAATIDDPRLRRLHFESLAGKIFPKKSGSGAADFDFKAWSAAHPRLAEELKRELARKKNEKGGGDEK